MNSPPPSLLPDWFEWSQAAASYYHDSVGSECFGLLWKWGLVEAIFGVVWGSLSWLLQWSASRWSASPLWAAGQVAALEAIVLGFPLSRMYVDVVNFSLAGDDFAVTISNGAIAVNVAGILLAFPSACLFAAYRSAPRKSAPASVKETVAATHKDATAVWPPPPKTSPPDEG